MRTKQCQRCDNSFDCQPENISECQCNSIAISEKTSLFLRNSFFDCLCKNCLLEIEEKTQHIDSQYIVKDNHFIENLHYYREGSKYVFTEAYLLSRGYCCQSACRHCPYGFTLNSANPF
jgi:hypothetical protein